MKFVRYIAVQVFAYGLDMGGFILMANILETELIAANVFGKIIAGVFAFFAHRSFTFNITNETKHGRQAIMYFMLLILNVPLSSAVLSLILLSVSPPILAKFIADVICVFVTFWLSKKYVFTKRRRKSADSNIEQSSIS